MTPVDWMIVAFCLLMAYWGYQQGLIVGALGLVGFAGGAFLGSRLGPMVLSEGAESPYAPVTALAGALLIGGIVAVSLEGVARSARHRLIRTPGAATVDGTGGAALLVALALGLSWLFGAVALNAPGAPELRQAVQRSLILRELNAVLPPSGFIINALNRIDPLPEVPGPDPGVGRPDPAIAGDPDVDAAGNSVVRVLGTACGLGVEGSGWLAAPEMVVTNAHVVAGQNDTSISTRAGRQLGATPVHFDPENDLALLRVAGTGASPLPFADARTGTPGAVLGYPQGGPFRVEAARLGPTRSAISQDAYGRGPLRRELTTLRGTVRRGNSGGPMVDSGGRVLTTVFAASTTGQRGGLGIPNGIVRAALQGDTREEEGTGPCTR